jgi:hypothetical protein
MKYNQIKIQDNIDNMRPIFTVHAGEFLVGEYIEKNYRNLNVWVPSKDTGVDLLVTNKSNSKSVSLQVKLSRDYRSIQTVDEFVRNMSVGGWLTLDHKKISTSAADLWVFILVSHEKRVDPKHLIIKPQQLLTHLVATHGESKKYNFYPWVMKNGVALDGRGLSVSDKNKLLAQDFELGPRDYSKYLSNWDAIDKLGLS